MRRIYSPNSVTTLDGSVMLGQQIEKPKAKKKLDDAKAFALGDEEIGFDYVAGSGKKKSSLKEAKHDDEAFETVEEDEKHATINHEREEKRLKELSAQIIAQATTEASRLIEEGHAKAQEEYQNAMRRAQEQISADCKAGRAQGYAEALKEHSAAIKKCVQEVEAAICRIESAQAAFITGYESDLKWTALEIAQKILADTIKADETRLIPLVIAALRSVKSSPWMTVELSENAAGVLSELQEQLKAETFAGKVDFKLIPAPADTCVIETTDKFFDASISQQIENLKAYFSAEQG